MCRELTRDERKGIRKLVTEMCANYDREYGCLPLDCECYMLGKCSSESRWNRMELSVRWFFIRNMNKRCDNPK